MMNANYPLRVRQNILPLSIADNLPDAFQEWYFTERTHDHETPDAECELCDKEELRYHFQIKNHHTDHQLWVGSKCILKFGVSVYGDGVLLDEEDAKKKLHQLTKKMQLESCIKALTNLAAKEKSDILKNALEFYRTNKYLTPKFAFVVFWRLRQNNIDHRPSFFKISLKKDKYKYDLRQMETSKVHMFWKALSAPQKQMALDMGHSAPKD